MGRETNNFSQKQLIIADGLRPKIKQLLRGAKHEAVEIDHESNPLDKITSILVSKKQSGIQIDTLHIIAHGQPGSFRIGGQTIDQDFLTHHLKSSPQIWGINTLALWSCEKSRGSGSQLEQSLEKLSGGKAWTSKQKLSGRNKSSWRLDNKSARRHGRQKPTIPIKRKVLAHWNHTLSSVLDVNYE